MATDIQPRGDPAPFETCLLEANDNAPIDHIPYGMEFSASYRDDDGKIHAVGDNLAAYLPTELSVERLDKIHNLLWLCGLPRPPRSLHHQILLNREIVITERLDMHLVWGNGRIYLKPMPRFLLDPTFWKTKLVCEEHCRCESLVTVVASPTAVANVVGNGGQEAGIGKAGNTQEDTTTQDCPMKKNRRTALGFMFTYAALIPHESDFAIALDKRLLPQNEQPPLWGTWRELVREILRSDIYEHIDRRFIYGELRLDRLNWIYRFHNFWKFRPYHTVWQNYSSFFHDQLGWMATTTVFIVVILTAMQVGATTDRLANNDAFQAASYGFSVFAILGPICAVCLILLCFLFKVVQNWLFSAVSNKIARRRTPDVNQAERNVQETLNETV